jgi:hypothetical protein
VRDLSEAKRSQDTCCLGSAPCFGFLYAIFVFSVTLWLLYGVFL